MRGTHVVSILVLPIIGITPARAGNTQSAVRLPACHEDHPRPCGEHKCNRYRQIPFIGSPPPVRGTPMLRSRRAGAHRITPARAGNTISEIISCPCVWDHPRPCGEHYIRELGNGYEVGSPPPVRGTQPVGGVVIVVIRITPARAGNTCRQHFF